MDFEYLSIFIFKIYSQITEEYLEEHHLYSEHKLASA